MAQTVGSHGIAAFTAPNNGDSLDANVVKGNDNTIRSAYVDHDSDGGIHVQSSLLIARPAAGQAGRKWLTTDTGAVKLWFDNGSSWQEINYVPTGDITTDLLPDADNTHDIGAPADRWKDVYAVDFYGSGANLTNLPAPDANDLIGTTLAPTVVTSSLTSLGTLTALDVTGDSTLDNIKLQGSTSGEITVQAPAAPTSWTATLPPTAGALNQVLSTNGAGVLGWLTAATVPTDTTISETTSAPYAVTTADVDKRLIINGPSTGGVAFLPGNTNSIAVGSKVQIAAFGAGAIVNPYAGALDRLTFDDLQINGSVDAIVFQSDGKIILGGAFTSVAGQTRSYLARLNTDGSLDTTFTASAGASVSALAVQSDDKILVGGSFTTVNSTTRNRIARLNSDGTLDTGYNPNANSTVSTIAIQSDGKAVVGGSFTTIVGTARNRIARLNTDGTLDTMNPDAGASVLSLAIQSDGKILVGGTFTTIVGTARNLIARLNSDGTLDTGYNPNVSTGTSVTNIVLQSDGKAIIGGNFTAVSATTRNYIARINTDGTLDTGYNPNANAVVNRVAVQSDGKAVVVGNYTNIAATTRNRIARINTDGTLDTGYDPNANGNASSVALTAAGVALIGGTFTTVGGLNFTRFTGVPSTGTFPAFYAPIVNGTIRAFAEQSDGKVIIGGDFTTVNGVTRNRIARLNADGSLDTGYNPDANGIVRAIVLQSDGKAVVGGDFTSIAGSGRQRLNRLTTTGASDGTWTDPSIGGGNVYTIALESNGTPIVGGDFTQVNASPSYPYVMRCANANGGQNTSWVPTPNAIVRSVAVQLDGTILIGGDFTTVAGGATTRNYLARYSSATATTLLTDTTNVTGGVVNTIRVNADNSLYIGGAFTAVGGYAYTGFAALRSSGAVDPSFQNLLLNGAVNTVAVSPYGIVYIGGAFTTAFGDAATPYLIAVLQNGARYAVLTNFPSAGAVETLFMQTVSNSLLLGGQFTGYGGFGRQRIAQLDFTGDLINAPYVGATVLPRYTVVTLEKRAAGSWVITESNAS